LIDILYEFIAKLCANVTDNWFVYPIGSNLTRI
jgi:hypothetical protein